MLYSDLAEPMPGRSAVRSRPYGDPYTEADDDRLSIVSPWSIEEDVRRLLYEEDSIMEVGLKMVCVCVCVQAFKHLQFN